MNKSVLIIAAFLFSTFHFVNAQNYSTTCHISNQGHYSYHKKKKVKCHTSYNNHSIHQVYACCMPVHQPMHYPNHPSNTMHRYISDGQMYSIISAIDEESFSSSKMQVAKQATRNRLMSSSQVVQIARLFSFESDRLEFAKYAYNFTYDKNNYYLVNSVFSFSSSKNELNQYVMQQF